MKIRTLLAFGSVRAHHQQSLGFLLSPLVVILCLNTTLLILFSKHAIGIVIFKKVDKKKSCRILLS